MKDLMNFINGTQDQKNLEVMLMLMLFQDLQSSCRRHHHLQIDNQCGKPFWMYHMKILNCQPRMLHIIKIWQKHFNNILQKIILRYWEMQWNVAKLQTDYHEESMMWQESGQYQITASICKSAVLLGEKLSPEASKILFFNWLRAKLWFPRNIVTVDMK